MKDLFLIRHGQAASGASRMARDFCLTELGRKQAHLLGKRLQAMGVRPDRIYASALTRARHCGFVHLQFFTEAGGLWPALCADGPDGGV